MGLHLLQILADGLTLQSDPAIQHHLTQILHRPDLALGCFVVPEHCIMQAMQSGDLGDLPLISGPVLNVSTNPINTPHIREFAQEIWGLDGYLMLGWDASQRAADLVYWPYFFLEQRRQPRRPWQPRKHRISMLSGVPRPHRIHLWQQIRDHVTAADMVVVNRFASWLVDSDLSEQLPWSNHPELIEPDQNRALTSAPTTSMDHPAYLACVNVTAETVPDPDQIFVTEKTWKAIAAGCMPWHGHAARAGYLAEMGFEDWFQESQPDPLHISDLLCRDNIERYYHDHLEAVMAAENRFWSHNQALQQTQEAQMRLQNWIRT